MRIRLLLIVVGAFAALLFLTARSHAVSSVSEFDLVITNGRIVDGTGNPWFAGSVAIKNGQIADIGRIAAGRGERLIDAQGMVVAPGFIDVHAHIESSGGSGGIENIPTADNYLQMGVTSVITGNCGGSAWPLGSWLTRLEKGGVSINIGSLVGHNTLRRAAMNGDFNRPPTPEERERMRTMVEQAMKDGAVGLSTGMIYIPGTYAKTDEIIELARVASRYGGIYATHMRDEGTGIEKSIDESLLVGQQSGCPVEISHHKIVSRKKWGDSIVTLRMISDARRRGQQVTVDQYLYTASSTNMGERLFIPSWAFEGGAKKTNERLRDPTTRARIKQLMLESAKREGQQDFSYAYVANFRANPSFNGKTITEVTKLIRNQTGIEEEVEQILNMVAEGGASMVYHLMSDEDVARIFSQPFTMVAADGGIVDLSAPDVPHPRNFGNNARALGVYAREKKLVSIEEAIRKMASLPAQTFNLLNRGLLRPGMAADLVIFDEKTIGDKATFTQPKQYPTGIAYVLVNGQIVIEKGKHTGARPGQVLHGRGKSV